MPDVDPVLVLGGGPAGLATAWALEELQCPYLVLEAAPVPGGNARTLRSGDFLYDTGPHRFHDRDPEATRRVQALLGPDLHEVRAPSRIFWHGRFVDFPLRPLPVPHRRRLRPGRRGRPGILRGSSVPPPALRPWRLRQLGPGHLRADDRGLVPHPVLREALGAARWGALPRHLRAPTARFHALRYPARPTPRSQQLLISRAASSIPVVDTGRSSRRWLPGSTPSASAAAVVSCASRRSGTASTRWST